MSWSTGQKLVDFVLNATPAGQTASLFFFGGEPLLRFDLIQAITGYIGDRAKKLRRQVRIGVTTNGTLLTPAIVDYFREQRIDVCVSLDGPAEIHDRSRVYPDGSGSFGEVIRSVREAGDSLESLQINAVYGPETIDSLPESVCFLVQFASSIHLNPDVTACWTPDAVQKFSEALLKVADVYVECFEQKKEIGISVLDGKMLAFLKGGYSAGDQCRMGDQEWGFAPSGNIYPCERFIQEDESCAYCMGNIHSGLRGWKRCASVERRSSPLTCRACELHRYCFNSCGCTNYHLSGSHDTVGSVVCAHERSAIRAAASVLMRLRDNELFLAHLMKHMPEEAIQD